MDDTQNPFREEEEEEQKESEEEIIVSQDDIKEDIKEEDDNSEPQDNKYEELNNKYIRLAADFDNFRKRTQQEKEELSKYTTAEVLKKITSCLDTFDRAKEHLENVEDVKKVNEGWDIAYKQLLDTLNKIGLTEIEAIGKPFDPNEHEAITQVETEEYEPDTVALIAQKGYKYQDKIVRAALVGVAKKKENE